ncbi:AAEL011269-PA [Aedes aegypti]|uniref:AAEL011269-PA n=1 Tax=Aedes aegypti TaxID=7159 RepID=Q16QK4_AEDAE|nr:AAEL011269-PA [Aedes aegypti]
MLPKSPHKYISRSAEACWNGRVVVAEEFRSAQVRFVLYGSVRSVSCFAAAESKSVCVRDKPRKDSVCECEEGGRETGELDMQDDQPSMLRLKNGKESQRLKNLWLFPRCSKGERTRKMIRRDQPTQSSASSTTLADDGTTGTAIRDFRSKSIDGGTARRDSKDRSNRNSALQSPSNMVYMPVGVNQIKEEANDPDIHPDSEVSLDANSTLAQVLEDFSNDEAPHEPEIEIKTHPRVLEEPTFRKHHFSASQKALQLQQMGNLAYQLSDQLFKPAPLNILTKDMLEQKITEKDPDLVYRKHHNNNSTWARYMPMYYKGVKQNYVRCLECGWLVLHKASTGTGSLLRHKCKIKLPSGVEVKIEQQTPSTRNLPSKATAAVGSTSSHAVKFQTTVMPQNVVDDLVRQQACFLYKDLSSVDLFDSHSFRTFAQMLVNIGVYYGQQDIAFLADRTRLMDQVLPTIYQQARIQLNQALVDCDLSYSFNLFRNEAEGKTFATINSYTVAEDYYFRKINVKTVPVEDLESFVEGLPSIIIDMIEKEHNEPLKLVYGTKLDVRNDDFELIPSRDRFLESSQQIEALVERFARESPIPEAPINPIGSGKIPLAYGKPGELKVWGILYLRLLAATFSCGYAGMKAMFLRLLALPMIMGLMWLFYSEAGDDAHGFFSKSGMILSVLGLSYGVGIWTTISLFPAWRKRFCQEYSEGMYTGATLLVAYNAVSMPFSFISSAVASCVLYPLVLNPTNPDGLTFMYILIALWSSFILAEQLSIAFLLVVKSQINASIAVSYILVICLTLASGTVRSHKGLSPWLQENAKGVHTKYASSLLHTTIFHARQMDCNPSSGVVCPQPAEYLLERIGKAHPQETTDLAACIAFALGMCAFNMFLYLLPMPRCVRRKFRD